MRKILKIVLGIFLLLIAGTCLFGVYLYFYNYYMNVKYPEEVLNPVMKEIVPKGTVLCNVAFAIELKPAKRSSPVGPVVVLMKDWESQDYWLTYGGDNRRAMIFKNTTLKPQEVQAIACIRREKGPYAYYTNGVRLASTNWDVRLVRWPDGEILETQFFKGEGPPSSINTGSGWHPPDLDYEFSSWLESLLK